MAADHQRVSTTPRPRASWVLGGALAALMVAAVPAAPGTVATTDTEPAAVVSGLDWAVVAPPFHPRPPAPEQAVALPTAHAAPAAPATDPAPSLLDVLAQLPVDGAFDVPDVVLGAYRLAESRAGTIAPGCRVRWSVLAGIGRVESGHARQLGRGTTVAADGAVTPPIVGPQLDGAGSFAAIPDTDGGALDGDATWDRAAGPMQFIPGSWRTYGQDGNGDGLADPHNLYDATLAAVAHLCRGTPGDYRDPAQLGRALMGYNPSPVYVAVVQRWIAYYDGFGPRPGPLPAPVAPADPRPVAVPPPPPAPLPEAIPPMATPPPDPHGAPEPPPPPPAPAEVSAPPAPADPAAPAPGESGAPQQPPGDGEPGDPAPAPEPPAAPLAPQDGPPAEPDPVACSAAGLLAAVDAAAADWLAEGGDQDDGAELAARVSGLLEQLDCGDAHAPTTAVRVADRRLVVRLATAWGQLVGRAPLAAATEGLEWCGDAAPGGDPPAGLEPCATEPPRRPRPETGTAATGTGSAPPTSAPPSAAPPAGAPRG